MFESMSFMSFILFGFLAFLPVLCSMYLRRVVSTNEVHIVQRHSGTVSYGKDQKSAAGKLNGNVYWKWPSWVPYFGLTVITLPTFNFQINLEDYEAFDKGRLPFAVDVTAFFQINNSNVAAQKVANFQQLQQQLQVIVQGAVRAVLAKFDIDQIMEGRSTLGDAFTQEVNSHLEEWGVKTVQSVELMDIRDGHNGKAIQNIMDKKKSQIDAESRIEVAKNRQSAEIAEINSKRETDLQKQQAEQAVGLRSVENQRAVALAGQEATQAIKESEKTTKEKEMAVTRVAEVKRAEIDKEKALVKADQDRQQTVIAAEARLEQEKKGAEGIEAKGKAEAEAKRLMEMAPVTAQIQLAEKVGGNLEYQNYMVRMREVEAREQIGIHNAEALTAANIKIIANSGNANEGISSIGDLFSSKGGTQVGAMLEGLMNTDAGKQALAKLGVSSEVIQ